LTLTARNDINKIIDLRNVVKLEGINPPLKIIKTFAGGIFR